MRLDPSLKLALKILVIGRVLPWVTRRPVEGKRIAMVGDSHAEALQRTAGALVRAAGGSFVADARSGWSTARYAASGAVSGVSAGADYLIVVLGTNDGVPDVEAAHRIVQQAGSARVVWWGPPPLVRSDVRGLPWQIGHAYQPAVFEAGGLWVDSTAFLSFDLFNERGIHLTQAGYERWAGFALRQVFRV